MHEMVYKAIVQGEAVPQGRPRFAKIGNHVTARDPEKSRNYKAYVRMVCAQSAPERPVEGAVCLKLLVFRLVPKSWSKKKQQAALDGKILPTSRPDLSNIQKGIEDALNGLWYKDDSQIVNLLCSARYSTKPRVEIELLVLV